MKLLLPLLAVAGLTGCVGYAVPYGNAGVYYENGSPYYGAPYYYGGAPYYGAPYYGGSVYYGHTTPRVIEQRPRYIPPGGHPRVAGPEGISRDRDRDGVPDRFERDRDGDGVPDRRDAAPGDPRRR